MKDYIKLLSSVTDLFYSLEKSISNFPMKNLLDNIKFEITKTFDQMEQEIFKELKSLN